MDLIEKLMPLATRHKEISARLSEEGLETQEYIALSKEYAELDPVVEVMNAYEKALQEREDLQEMVQDPEMKEMAQADLDRLYHEIPELEERIKLALIPKDSADTKNAILEIRAGTGGDEAALFASDLFSMYKAYASQRGWKLEIMEASENELGGYREIIAEIAGTNVFERMKYESGVHRVQRVPKTETQGRVHTSAATVAVLPEAEDVDIELNENDLRVDVFRSSGPGGQSVNTTDSAVRITHIPTGVSVAIQDEKSQHKNKAKAMKILKTKLFDLERQKAEAERAANRKSQVGSGDRSERIRTYNFPQSRVTDHRVNLTSHNLDGILRGEGLDEVIDALITEDQTRKLSALAEAEDAA